MGGPPLYSQRRGHPALIARHRPFPVTHQAAERHTAYFLVAGDELKSQNQQMPASMQLQPERNKPCRKF
ncbi:Two-on-two hemoglobin-3 [Senna tora]|uniref:Two-on-two hemoglobin-3 n=1 Tax=Senna tora TaxID=362788 RepID=A0A834T8F1_9FABA|nr:Two-on-two hemoglobin-3 [Senna tora]